MTKRIADSSHEGGLEQDLQQKNGYAHECTATTSWLCVSSSLLASAQGYQGVLRQKDAGCLQAFDED